ncbi:MAG: FeoA family protein [Actinomycetota bacterium]
MVAEPSIPLAFLSSGETGVVTEIRAPRHHRKDDDTVRHAGPSKGYSRGHLYHTDRGHRMIHRLGQMGLHAGSRVKVIRNEGPGPLLIAVGDSRIALGRGIASRVMVVPKKPGPLEPGLSDRE